MSTGPEKEFPMFIVDAFTDKPFAGNAAAVCLLNHDQDLSDAERQKIASEMNLSETAFVRVTDDTSGDFSTGNRFELRWFTPAVEVPLCGHATLASAAVLFRCTGNKSDAILFDTVYSGQLRAVRDGDYIKLDLPENKPRALTESESSELEEVIKSVVGNLKVQDVQFSPNARKLLIRIDDSYSLSTLEKLQPSLGQLTKIHSGKVYGVIVTLKGRADDDQWKNCQGEHFDFASRYFAPWVGINEDPVTGSAHTVLGPYWSEVFDKNRLVARQCSPRGGDLLVTWRKADGRVDVGGRDVIVLRGTINASGARP